MCPMNLDGKRILITGASSGIGAACARSVAALGAHVTLLARNAERLEQVRKGLDYPERHVAIEIDLSAIDAIEGCCAFMHAPFDGFVHAAGISPMVPVRQLRFEKAFNVFSVNYFSFIELMRVLTKSVNRSAHFSAVAISSVSALRGCRGGAAYCGSKGALSATVRSMAVELATKGVRVNSICPAMIDTPMYRNQVLNSGIPDEATLASIKSQSPLGIGTPEQVANVVSFLLSDASSYITGVELPVDGGKLA